jgi:hypothetical protein
LVRALVTKTWDEGVTFRKVVQESTKENATERRNSFLTCNIRDILLYYYQGD